MTIKKVFNSLLIIMILSVSVARSQNASNSPDKIIDKIVGTWKIQRIMSGENEVAKNPTSGQWIEFRSDGKYVHQLTMADSGSYRIDENRSVLFLESSLQAGESKNSPKKIDEWHLAFSEGTMTLKRSDTTKNKKQHKDKMSYIYVKIADGESVKADPK